MRAHLYQRAALAARSCAALLVLGGLGCRTRSERDTRSGGPPSAQSVQLSVPGGALPPDRAQAIEQADRMAAEAARTTGPHSQELLTRAAQWREALFRREHRAVDGLEAVELFKALERSGAVDCAKRLERVLLEAELEREPLVAYRRVYALRLHEDDPSCMASAERALVALAAYRPLPNVLAEIERNEAEQSAESLRGRGVAPGVADAGARAASAPARDIVVPRGAANGSERAEITRVERYGAEDAARVVVFVTRPTRFEIGEVHSDADRPRLFVDIDDAVFAGKASYEVGGLVQRVRLGTESKTTRVVLDLSATVQSKVFYLPEPFRLVIDVSKESPHAIASARGARSVRRVVLDPGHGGNDPGATGPSGLREKDVVLDIAHRAAPLIARELGIATLLTRDRDDYVPLDERAARANAFHADLFVSIHCNASEDPVAKGVMTFVLDQGREDVAERVAARENAASSEAAAELSNAVSRITDRASREASLHFAELLQRSTAASLAPHYPEVPNAGVKRAGFYVLAGARMPAVLYEASFISTSAGEARLNTDDFRQKLADAIVNAVRAYRDGL